MYNINISGFVGYTRLPVVDEVAWDTLFWLYNYGWKLGVAVGSLTIISVILLEL